MSQSDKEKADMFIEIRSMLPKTLFAGSKDWVAGDTVNRVEWLLLTIDTLKERIEYLEVDVKTAERGA